jgi:ferritin-like metal-binding protein YciE
MAINSPHDLFVHNLKEMYYVETQLVEMLGELASDTPNDQLSQGFSDHRTETERQVDRLRQVFEAIGEQPESVASPVLDGLVQQRQNFLSEVGNDDLKTPFYLAAGIKTEQIEITSYQSLLMLANQMDLGDDVKNPLQENLDEEQSTLRQLRTMEEGSKLKELISNLM